MRLNFFIVLILFWGTTFSQPQKLNWKAWGTRAFEEAKANHKPIFLDVGTEWCTACNFMEDETYTDTTVINLLNTNFVLIKADAEAQPDVGARFLQWGWPALIFLNEAGEQLWAFQGNRKPALFVSIIKDFLEKYKRGDLKPDAVDYYSPETPEQSELKKVLNRADKQLDSYYDPLYGGWGFNLKIPLYQPIEYSLWKYAGTKSPAELNKVTKSLSQYARISDRIWGGVYFGCSSGRNWGGAQPEKRSEYQGGVISNYAQAAMATGDKKWLGEAGLLKKYLLNMMLDKTDSLFYNSQEEYLTASGNPPGMPPEKYFTLPAEQRLKYGIPAIDKTFYTDINFRIVRGFLKLYEASGDPTDLTLAVNTAKHILARAKMPGGWFKTIAGNKNINTRIRELPADSLQGNVLYLKTQGQSAMAMLSLYQFTGDTSWLQRCYDLHKVVYRQLYDSLNGGFYSTNLMPLGLGGKRTATKVLAENAIYARFLIELSDLAGDGKLLKIAEGALRAVASEKTVGNEERLIADFNLALDKLMKHHLVFTVVSNHINSEETKKLVWLVQSYYHPQKLMKIEKPGHYPDLGGPSLFVCSDKVCSSPLSWSVKTKDEITKFIVGLK